MKSFPLKLIIIAYSAILGIIIFAVLFSSSWLPVVSSDFLNYYVGATIIKKGNGNRLYDASYNYQVQSDVLEGTSLRNITIFRSLPSVLFFILPFTYFKVDTAYKLYMIFNVFLLGVITLLSFKVFENIRKARSALGFAPWIYLPALFTLQRGQTSLILTLLLFLIYITLKKKKWFLAGFISPFMILKTQFIISLPFFFILAKDKKKFLSGLLLSGLTLLLLNLSLAGFDSLANYSSYLAITENPEFGSRLNAMFTLYSSLATSPLSWFVEPAWFFAANGALYTLVLILFFRVVKNESMETLFLAATIFTIVFSMFLTDLFGVAHT